MSVSVIGVRHHSPACARLVEHVIGTRRPKWVLIEGPSDMNGRLAELRLKHRLPIAIFSFAVVDDLKRSCFFPFAEFSPEWAALAAAEGVGAQARFVDLPGHDQVFDGLENAYSDRHLMASDRLPLLARRVGFDDLDSLWDHLFEQPQESDALATRLAEYFDALRADEPGSEHDQRRERFMAEWIAWAHARGDGDVVVVCGGYHKHALERLWPTITPTRHEPARPPREGRHGAYLVPFSDRRLDSFSGYAAGMPSPRWLEHVFRSGPVEGPARMLEEVVVELRNRKQRVSSADVIAVSTMTEGLRALRGHAAVARTDLLDGLATALVKEALSSPLPWSRRAALDPRTHPMLLAILQSFSGERRGQLAPETPRPQLVEDVEAELDRVGFAVGRRSGKLEADRATDEGRDRSFVLHRLRVLAIPGVSRTRAPRFSRQDAVFAEHWDLHRGIEFEPSVIEAAVYGATLEVAAAAKLESRVEGAHAGELAAVVQDADLAGIADLPAGLLDRLTRGFSQERDLSALGQALARLVRILDDDRSSLDHTRLGEAVRAALDRALWLIEGLSGDDAPLISGHVDAFVAVRDALRKLGETIELSLIAELLERRAADASAPPYVRGLAMGLRAALTHDLGAPVSDDPLVRAFRAMRGPFVGDFLVGLFALAREELSESEPLLAAIVSGVEDMSAQTFLVTLPSMRQAFDYFPPRERAALAERLLERYGSGDKRAILGAVDLGLATLGQRREIAVRELAQKYGLGDETP